MVLKVIPKKYVVAAFGLQLFAKLKQIVMLAWFAIWANVDHHASPTKTVQSTKNVPRVYVCCNVPLIMIVSLERFAIISDARLAVETTTNVPTKKHAY